MFSVFQCRVIRKKFQLKYFDIVSDLDIITWFITQDKIHIYLLLTFMLMKLSPHSLATTPANNVFPVPGAPYSSIPDLSLRGQEENNMGYWKCPTISVCLCLTHVFINGSIESFSKCNFISFKSWICISRFRICYKQESCYNFPVK